MQDVPNETPPIIRQTTSIVDGKVFITTEKVQKDIKGKEFIVLKTTQPYDKSVEEYKAALEEAKAKEIERHETVIADVDAKIADAEAVIVDTPTPVVDEPVVPE